MHEVLEGARFVARHATMVRIHRTALKDAARAVLAYPRPDPWQAPYHYAGPPAETLGYVFVLDAINFCFWPEPGEGRWTIRYRGEALSGYFALAAALKRALEQGIPITKARFLRDLSWNDFLTLLEGEGRLPLMEERWLILRELGRALQDQWDGDASRLLDASNGSAVRFVGMVTRDFPSFRDAAPFKGRQVPFYKRAQILASDLHAALKGTGWGGFKDLHRLTAFADYKLPQVLRHLGVLEYEESLARKVDDQVPLPSGSREEVEIRAHTILAVEGLRREMALLGSSVPAVEIDAALWHMGQEDLFRLRPYHRTLSIYY